MKYKYSFDHIHKKIYVASYEVNLDSPTGKPIVTYLATYSFYVGEKKEEIRLIDGSLDPDAYKLMRAAFKSWVDVSRGTIWSNEILDRLEKM